MGAGDSSHAWWETSVVYQIYPRSFADADGDGIGDLAGITQRLDHLTWLGVDALWLSPVFVSPMADFGYDVADYCDIDPVFGDLADLDTLVEEAHRRGLRVLLDWVPNHTSDQHPWFVDSRRGRDSARRDWYVWRDPAPDGGPPNNWGSAWGHGPAWTLDEASGQYHLHLFLPEQPDLDWHHPEVEAAMHEVLRFWLDRGIDGYRADVVHLIGKDPALPDLPPERAGTSPILDIDEPATHEFLRRIRRLLDGYDHQPMMVGEVYLLGEGQAAGYLGAGDELHLVFDFRPVHTPWEAEAMAAAIRTGQTETAGRGRPTWVLGNHDQPRQRTRYGSDARARAAALLTLTVRATPFLYAGEELGLPDAAVAEHQKVDPGGRDGCRAPLPWTPAPSHGWGPAPWLPFVDGAAELSAESQRHDPASMLRHYRRLLRLRRSTPTLVTGHQATTSVADGVLSWVRHRADERLDVAVNFTDEPAAAELPSGARILMSTHPERIGSEADGRLLPDEAVVVVPPDVGP